VSDEQPHHHQPFPEDEEGEPRPQPTSYTMVEPRFRERYSLALLMVRRGSGLLLPDAHLRFALGDRLVVFGPRDRIAALRAL